MTEEFDFIIKVVQQGAANPGLMTGIFTLMGALGGAVLTHQFEKRTHIRSIRQEDTRQMREMRRQMYLKSVAVLYKNNAVIKHAFESELRPAISLYGSEALLVRLAALMDAIDAGDELAVKAAKENLIEQMRIEVGVDLGPNDLT